MNRALILLLIAVSCFSFRMDPSIRFHSDDLIGTWKFVETKCDGLTDSSANSVKEFYFVFGADHLFRLDYRRDNEDTTMYHIGGKYSVNAKKGTVKTRCFDAGRTKTRYAVQKLNENELVLVTRGYGMNRDRVYTTYFKKVK